MQPPCILLDYFDIHDVYHMVSAVSGGLVVQFLYTVDTGVATVPQASINVF
jgi:hypothetical protein